jgi:hypothetical protein
LLAGLPVSTDDIPAEDQLMLLGIAQVFIPDYCCIVEWTSDALMTDAFIILK